MSTFKNKNSLRTIEAQIVQKLKKNEARPKFTGSYKTKACSKYENLPKSPSLACKGWRPLRSCQYPSHSGKKEHYTVDLW